MMPIRFGALVLCLLCFPYNLCCQEINNKLEFATILRQSLPPVRQAVIQFCPENYAGSEKICNIRDMLYRQKWFHIEAGFQCYGYVNPDRFVAQFKQIGFVLFSCNNDSLPPLRLHVTRLPDKRILWFDYKNETTRKYVRESFKTEEYFKLWLDCCEEADKCCKNAMTNENVKHSAGYCPAIWDAWTCFDRTKNDTVARKPCSKQVYSSPALCELQSEKQCFGNGNWNDHTDYSTCSVTPFRIRRIHFHAGVLAASTLLCLPAVVIFSSFRRFRRTLRTVLHRNLVLAIVVRNLLTTISETVVILDSLRSGDSGGSVMAGNGAGCRTLAFLEGVAKNAMYACMMVDGFYLHKLIVRTFADDPSVYLLYGVVAGVSLVPSLIWATCNAMVNAQNCWMVDEGYQVIIDGFRIAVLIINVLLLADIVRSIISKLKYSSSSKQTRQAKATLNATLFLIPLFGIHILLTMYRGILGDNRCEIQDIYYYISYSMEALQGVMVAFLFCYINNEVHKELQNFYRKCVIHLQQRYNISLSRNSELHRRRTTATTIVNSETTNARRSIFQQQTPANQNASIMNTLEPEITPEENECNMSTTQHINRSDRRVTIGIINDTGSTDL